MAAELNEDIGYEPLDAGPLRTGRFAEPFAMVTAELAYEQAGGPKLTYRFSKFSAMAEASAIDRKAEEFALC